MQYEGWNFERNEHSICSPNYVVEDLKDEYISETTYGSDFKTLSALHEIDPVMENEEEEHLQEPHLLVGSLKMVEQRVQEALKILHDTHASVSKMCWEAALMEDQSSFEAMENLQKAMSTIKINFSQLLSDKNYMFKVVDLLWEASLHNEEIICIYEEENYKLKGDLLATQDSLRYTQSALLESQMKIEQFQQEWKELTESSIFLKSHSFWVNGME